MNFELHRHDISDKGQDKIQPHTIREKGSRGGNAKNTRQFITGVFWILRTDAHWRNMSAEYGHWKMFIDDFVAGETKEFGKIF